MTWSHVQQTAVVQVGGGTVPALLPPFGSSVTVGNVITVSITVSNNPVKSVTDTYGNLYVPAVSYNTGGVYSQIYSAIVTTGGAANTISVNWSGSGSSLSIAANEYTAGSPISSTSIDGTTTGYSTSNVNTMAALSALTFAPGDLVVSAICADSATGTLTANSPFTSRGSGLNTTNRSGLLVMDYVPSTSPVTPAGNQTVAAGYVMAAVALNVSAVQTSPITIPYNHSGNITITLTGTGTHWVTGTTVFTIAGVTGVTKVSQNITSTTAATVVVTTASGTGTLTISDGTNNAVVAVKTPAISLAPLGSGQIWRQRSR